MEKTALPPERIWARGDGLAALVSAAISGAVYFWTAAPNVTLLDSGEFVVAAQHFGVPHPTGYPLWTLLAWLFQLLPLGNAAWEINLFSGFCGALAVGLAAALFSSSTRWMLGERVARWPGLNFTVSVTVALLFAFSFSMWSQAVIAEVYTLHALLIGLFLASLYVWLRRPESLWLLMVPFFLLALSFSNHQLSIALAPLPLLAVLLVRRGLFWDLVVAGAMTVLLVYLGFAILSGEPPVLKTAIRFFYCVMAGLAVLLVARRCRVEWRLIAYLPFVVALGLLPYAYMPLASSTNPPMNWAYTRTAEGFFFSFNRSQYGGSLSDQSLRSLGKLMGTSGATKAPDPQAASDPAGGTLSRLQEWVGFFWWKLGESFTPLGVLAYFVALLVVLRLRDVAARTWIYLLEIAFVLAAILQPFADGTTIDNGGWWLQMPYHTYTNFLFALLAGLGLVAGAFWFSSRIPRLAWMRFGLLALPLWPLYINHDGCSQRGRWFGWEFGHDMLRDLPQGSVVFGGTDPGRFVPTYMILGESPQPAGVKRDPAFDRRDLYIITQNGVGEPLYRKYLADHYGPERPQPANAFERWLERGSIYPAKPLVFPTEEEIQETVAREMKAAADRGVMDPSIPHSVVTRLIWEKNRDAHEFFVEESFPLEWSYDHAEPHGLLYKIHREPLKEIPAESVRADFEFWDAYSERLLSNPDYAKDYDAQRSFSKLRASTGNLYRHRKMDAEAERAYRQALALWVGNGESLNGISQMLWERGEFDGVIKMFEAALEKDPNNVALWRMFFLAENRKKIQGLIVKHEEALRQKPDSREDAQALLELHTSSGDEKELKAFLEKSIRDFAKDALFLRTAAECAEFTALPVLELAAARALADLEPDDAENQYRLAKAAALNNDKPLCIAAARRAIELGGLPMREGLGKTEVFERYREDSEFQALLRPPNAGLK
jgi:tetratricopeptide (TPR) repeat protein